MSGTVAEDQTSWPVEPQPGTVAWIVTKRDMLRRALREERFNKDLAQALYQKIEQSGDWRLLSDMNGRPFSSFDAFCKNSNGLGLKREEIERRLTAQETAADPEVTAANPVRTAGPGRGKTVAISHGLSSLGGDSAERIVRRLKRDAPEIAARLASGEFRSARAAAKAAGFKVDTPPLTIVRRAWKRMSPKEREIFLREVSA